VGGPVAEPPAASAGDVEDGVDPSKPFGGVRDCLIRGAVFGEVGGQVVRFAALAADGVDKLAGVRFGPGRDEDAGAFPREAEGGRLGDAGRARDQADSPRVPHS
jgi:hypothetical protein